MEERKETNREPLARWPSLEIFQLEKVSVKRCGVCGEMALGSRIKGERWTKTSSEASTCLYFSSSSDVPSQYLSPPSSLVSTPSPPQQGRNWPAPPSQPPRAPPLLVGQKLTAAPAVVLPAVGTCAYSQSAPTPQGTAVSEISTSTEQRKSNTSLGREGMSVSDEN